MESENGFRTLVMLPLHLSHFSDEMECNCLICFRYSWNVEWFAWHMFYLRASDQILTYGNLSLLRQLCPRESYLACYYILPVMIIAFNFLGVLFRYGIEGPVYLMPRGQKGDGEWIIDEQQQQIKKINGKVSYGVLQTVRIHMEVVEPQPNRPKLELTLI